MLVDQSWVNNLQIMFDEYTNGSKFKLQICTNYKFDQYLSLYCYAVKPKLQTGPGYWFLYFRLDIILVKGLSKHTLNTYFPGIKIDPKYVFLHAFFFICPSCPFQNLLLLPITHPFFPILHVFAPLNDVRAYIAWSWKTTLIT